MGTLQKMKKLLALLLALEMVLGTNGFTVLAESLPEEPEVELAAEAVEEAEAEEEEKSAPEVIEESSAPEEEAEAIAEPEAEEPAVEEAAEEAEAEADAGEALNGEEAAAEGEALPEGEAAEAEDAEAAEAAEVSVKVSAVIGDSEELIGDAYTELMVPFIGDALDLTVSPIEGDVTRAVPVEGTNRLYVETFSYDYATIGGERVESLLKEAVAEDTLVLLHYSNPQTKTKYVYEDASIKVTATVNDPAAIPDDAEFVVRKLDKEKQQDAIDAYLAALNEQAAVIAGQKADSDPVVYDEENTLLYDFAFVIAKADQEGAPVSGEKVEYIPEDKQVKIDILFKKDKVDMENLDIIHLPIRENVVKAADSTQELMADLSVDDIAKAKVEDSRVVDIAGKENLEFVADGFSVRALALKKAPAANAAEDSYTVGLYFYNKDRQPGAPSPQPDGNYYVRLIVRDKEVQEGQAEKQNYAWTVVPISADQAANSVTVPFDTLQSVDADEDFDLADYPSDKYDYWYRIVHSEGEIDNYADALGAHDSAPAGYAWQAPDVSESGTTFKLIQSDKNGINYYARLDFTQPGISLSDSDNVYVLVTVRHASTGYMYGKVRVTDAFRDANDPSVYNVPITQWYNYSNNPVNDVFTGNEPQVKVQLVAMPQGKDQNDIQFYSDGGDLTYNSGAKVIAEGASLNEYVVESYPDSSDPAKKNRIMESDPNDSTKDVCYDIVKLNKTTAKIGGYSIEYLLENYGLVTLCPNDSAKTHTATSNGQSSTYTDGDIYLNTHTMCSVLVRGDWLPSQSSPGIADSAFTKAPSYVGGKVPSIPTGANGRGANKNPPALYVGSVNSVFGDMINGTASGNGGYNNLGSVAVSDDFVDWDRLQTSVISGSNQLKAGSTGTITITRDYQINEALEIPAGSNVTLINDNGYTVYIKLTGSNDASSSNAPVTVINCAGENVVLPIVKSIGGTDWNTYAQNHKRGNGSVKGDGDGLSILINCADAKTVKSVDYILGHVIAPKADIDISGGDYNGGVIGNSIFVNNEGHYWPYNGKRVTTDKGNLELTKTIKGSITEKQAEDSVKFEVKKSDTDLWVVGSGQLIDSKTTIPLSAFTHEAGTDTYTLKLDDLDVGKYTITETGLDGAIVSYKIDSGKTKKDSVSNVDLLVGKTTKVAYENNYEKKTGNLKITKTIDGKNVTEDDLENLTFTVKGPEGFETVTVKLGEFTKQEDGTYVYELKDIPVGEYTVSETQPNIEGYNVETTMSVEGGKTTVEDQKTAEIAITDSYTEQKGNLVIKKTVGGDVTEEEIKEAALKFEVKTPDGKWLDKDGNVSETKVELTLGEEDGFETTDGGKTWTKEFKDVAAGEYTVTETNSLIDGYKLKDSSTTDASATVEDGKEATAEITDEYQNDKVSISKVDAIGQEELEGAKIQILDSEGNIKEEWTSAKEPHVVKGLAAGTYTLHEVTAPDGYEVAADTDFTIGEDGTVTSKTTSKTSDGVLLVKDTRKPGKLTVTKSFGGDVTAEEIAEGAITITVKKVDENGETLGYLDKDGKLVSEETTLTLGKEDGFEISEDGKTWTKEFEKVEAGTYEIEEKNSTLPGYTLVTEKSTTKTDATVKAGGEETAELKNEYEKPEEEKKGDLIIRKTVGGDVTEEEIEKAALTFEVKTPDGKWLDKDGKVSDTKVELTLGEADGFTTTDGGKTWTKEFKDVAEGEYTVTETNSLIDGYKLKDSSTTEASATVVDGKEATAEIADEYEKEAVEEETGKLTVTKSFGGDVTKEEIEEGAITITVKKVDEEGNTLGYLDKDGKLVSEETTLTIGEADGFKPSEDGKTWTKEFEKVEAGTYEIEEKNSTLPGYTLVAEKSTTKTDATVKAGGEETAELKNEYEKPEEEKKGDLIIRKTVGGDVTEEEIEKAALTFEVKTPDGKWLDKDCKVSDTKVELTLGEADGFTTTDGGKTWTKEFKDVAEGEYTVTETNSLIDGYKLKDSSTTEASATVEDGKEATAEITDEYEKPEEEKKGDLIIRKTVGGDVTEEEIEKAALTFEVKTPDGKWLDKDGRVSDTKVELTLGEADGFTTTDGGKTWTKEFKDVAEGEYTVTETNSLIDGYKLKDSSTTEATATVEDGKEATAEITDEYEKPEEEKKGDLIIRKTVGGDVTEEEIEKAALTFEVKTPDGKWLDKDGKVSDTKVELTLGEADGFTTTDGGKTWTKEFKDVAEGEYTVTETNSLIDGYKLKDSSTTEASATVVDGKEATAEITDEYEKEEVEEETGKLTVTKSFGGDVTKEEIAEGAITITVKKVDEEGNTLGYLDKDGKLVSEETTLTIGEADGFNPSEDGKTWTKEFEKVEAGTYEIEEKNSTLPGYTLVAEKSTTKTDATVKAGGEETAELKNEYEKPEEEKKGDLIIRKTVGGDVTEEEIEKAALTFEVKTPDGKWLDKDGKVSDTKVELTLGEADGFTTTDGGKTWTKEFKDVAEGEYTVTETNSLIDGYKLKDSSTTEASATVEDGKEATAEITDEYEKPEEEKKGDLIIRKTVGGDVTEEEIEKAALTFEVKTPDGKWLDKDGKVSDTKVELTLGEADGFTTTDGGKTWTKEFKDVAEGEYTVTETNSLIDGYKLKDSSTTEATATVEDGKEATAEITDEYEKEAVEEETGKLTVTKSFGGDVTKEEIEESAITITVKKVDEEGNTLGYLDKDGKLVEEETTLTIGEADGFKPSEDGKTWTKEFEKVETGTYEIEEKNSTLPGYTLVTEKSTTKTDATVKAGGEETAELNNEYEKETEEVVEEGSIELTKTIKGDVTKEEAEGALTFVVKAADGKYLDKNGNLVESEKDAVLTLKDFTLDESTGKYTLLISHVAPGSYTVTETTKDFDGKEHTVKYAVDGAAQKDGKEASLTVEDGKTAAVAFEDTFKAQQKENNSNKGKTSNKGYNPKQKKTGSATKTGDDSPVTEWAALFTISAALMAFIIGKRKKEEEA